VKTVEVLGSLDSVALDSLFSEASGPGCSKDTFATVKFNSVLPPPFGGVPKNTNVSKIKLKFRSMDWVRVIWID